MATPNLDVLMLSHTEAAEYLGCSVQVLHAWVKPDRELPLSRGDPAWDPLLGRRRRADISANSPMVLLLWSKKTLDAAKPLIASLRERANTASAERQQQDAATRAERDARETAKRARRAGMRKAKALTATKVCEVLQCSRAELHRWLVDGRLPADGAICFNGHDANAWLPATIEAAKSRIEEWRRIDEIRKKARRTKLKTVKTD